MSMNTTSAEGAHQPALDDGGIHADGMIVPHGAVEATGEISTQPEFLSTHTDSVCKKVYVDSGNDKVTLYVLSIVWLSLLVISPLRT
jgi:hypothetical protein